MGYHIKLDLFEGPLDLLLHFISKAKIKIEDVSIAEITEQYLDYLDQMKEFDVEIASEFLVMAATLLYIKSRALLPKPEILLEDEVDPEEELIRRLAEYKKYKEASLNLKDRAGVYSGIFYKLPEEPVVEKDRILPLVIDEGAAALLDAFIKVMEKKNFAKSEARVHPIIRSPITVDRRIKELKRYLSTVSECSFSELVDGHYGRPHIIITFLALLEMLKANQIRIHQEGQFEDIIIKGAV
ncbi:MAG: segregation/condensation protein A [Clostridium sp.]|nr:segregation/condensation protein A [Clostridium sp.]